MVDRVEYRAEETPPDNPENQNQNQNPPQSNGNNQRPENIPEKFWDAEKGAIKTDELLKSYAELEKKFSSKGADGETQNNNRQNSDQQNDQQKSDKLEIQARSEEEQAAQTIVEKAGLSMDKLTEEFNETGALTDESYTALEKVGVPRTMVDAWIAGQVAQAEKFAGEIYATVNGREEYAAMTDWAAKNLSPEEIETFNRLVTKGSKAEAKMAVQGLYAQYTRASGKDPKLLAGNASSNVGAGSYQSVAELTADMSNPRYKTDPAYRKTVRQKLANSSIL